MNNGRRHEEAEASARRAIVKLCRAMLRGELSYFEGSLQIAPLRLSAGVDQHDAGFTPFIALNSETDHLPTAQVRHRWSDEALERLQPEFARTEEWGHEFVAPACTSLIRRFARPAQAFPEVYCDFNARMTSNGYLLETKGSIDALTRLGLSLEAAVGRRFTFVMDDADDDGEPDDIMFNGIVVKDDHWGYLALADADGVYWRSEVAASQA